MSNQTACQFPATRTQPAACLAAFPEGAFFFFFLLFFQEEEKQRPLREYPLANLKSKLNSEHGRLDDSCQRDKRYYQVGFGLLCWRQPGGVQQGFDVCVFVCVCMNV